MKRAKFFITCNELPAASHIDWEPEKLKRILVTQTVSKNRKTSDTQLSLFTNYKPALAPLH